MHSSMYTYHVPLLVAFFGLEPFFFNRNLRIIIGSLYMELLEVATTYICLALVT